MALSVESEPAGMPVGEPQPHLDGAPVLEVRNLRKHFTRADGRRVAAIDDVSFDLHAGEFMVLLGPSGCGKTTLLRSIAGLERPQHGEVRVNGATAFSSDRRVWLPPERRKLSMVFQSYALWPHMTVFDNIAYPLRSGPRPRPKKADLTARVEEMLATMKLDGLAKQYPNQLSGGQQQRVALCRALVAGSDVVLFDEPLSNVDAKVREQLRLELLVMQRQLGFAALFVTHDQQEAMALAHTIAVLDSGRMVQHDTPSQIYGAPATAGVASFVGLANQVGGVVIEVAGKDAVVNTSIGKIPAQRPLEPLDANAPLREGDAATVMWRPDAGSLVEAAPGESADGRWAAVVEQSCFYGTHTESIVRVDDHQFRVQVPGRHLIPGGRRVWMSIDSARVHVYPDITAPLIG